MQDYTLNPKYPLKDTQNEGVDFLLHRKSAILGFQTGLGKTLCALTAGSHVLMKYPDTHLVILCPASANKAFYKELQHKLNLPFSRFTTEEIYNDPNARVSLYNFSSLYKYTDDIRDLAQNKKLVLIMDEGHTIANDGTQQIKIVQAIKPQFKIIWSLTATPLLNHIEGLFNQMDFLIPVTVS